ncbi:hypothetical protein [Pseudoalteromonas sp. G4]|uniref:hypothetical protein n=1 Tax=Pseudoalteromonas sp. G4 TaxID=2992761 RepID=UPI00237E0DB9|nr:hypothetical protein [Pseudoalteromonas sp. G4]MDE3272086.1 hypothetical protein [Pseudoalteromonas sp. G4]
MIKKYSIIVVLILLLACLIWFANFHSTAEFQVPPANAQKHIADEPSVTLTENQIQKPEKTKKTSTVLEDEQQSYCKDQPRFFAKFERDKQSYLSQIAIAWRIQGESPFRIMHALENAVSKDAAERFMREVKLVSLNSEANQLKSQKYINKGLDFSDYIKEKHRYSFKKFRQSVITKDFVESYRKQVEHNQDIAIDILQHAFVQAVNIDNPRPDFDALLLLYDSYYSLNPSINKFITSQQLPYVLNRLPKDTAAKVLSRLLLIEQLPSNTSKSVLLARVGGIDKQFVDIINGAPITPPAPIESDELQSQLHEIMAEQKLFIDDQDVCQLYDVAPIDSNVTVNYIDANSLDYPHPSCDRLLSEQAKEIGMLALFSEISSQFLAAGIDLNNLNDAEQVKRADLVQVHEYLDKKPEFERELAYLLLYSRPMHSKRNEIIEALVTQGLYPKNANAVAVIQRLNQDDAIKMLERMGNVDLPNQRGESMVYNLMFINPELTSELINRGFSQKHSQQSPDPLLKMLHFLKENRESEKWIGVITALINNGAKIEAQHLNEVYRLQLTVPELYQQLTERHPELIPHNVTALNIVQCQTSE